MEFRLLGPVELWTAAGRVELGPAKQRTVLAALLVDAGRVVPVEVLVDRVWDAALPAQPRRVLQAYVARARAILRAAAAGGTVPQLTRRAGGYVLDMDPAQVDVHRFRAVKDDAHRTTTDGTARAAALRRALALWHGTALSGLPGRWAEQVRDSLEQERLDMVMELARLELRVGDPHRVLADLREWAARYPLSETITVLRMRALAETHRPAEALALYASARRGLIEELGVEPGPELRAVHQAVLRGDLEPRGVVAAARRVPAQLPADVAAFTGRAAELAALDAIVAGAQTDGPAVIAALSGTAGVGKTALAVRWAHRVARRFPDGQLYVNLHGYDPDHPVPPERALAGFLDALGVPASEVPVELADRAARYRSETAGRRLLVLLDNAASAEQVRPLLPGTSSTLVVVTSRDALVGLVAVHGARRLDLDLLPAADAQALLHRLIGDRADEDPVAVAALAEQCARLPLALRVAAELAVARPDRFLADLVAELADEQRRLQLLDACGDSRAAVTAAFSWSVAHLTPTAARLLRLAGLHPGPDLDEYAAAALAGTDLDQVRRLLPALTRAYLLQPVGDRYAMHDLLRAYAVSLTGALEPAPERRAALGRLFDHYLATAATAMDVLHPAEAHHRPRVPAVATPRPPLADPEAARRWLDAERPNLVAVAAYTATHGWPTHSARLSTTLFRYLDSGYYADALVVHDHARVAARQAGDPAGEAEALHGLGAVHWRLSRYEQSVDSFTEALRLFERSGDRMGQARASSNLSSVHWTCGRYGAALGHQQRALALFQQVGDRVGEAHALANLANVQERLGRYQPAAETYRQALALFRAAGEPMGRAWTLTNLGLVEARLDDVVAAAGHLQQALTLFDGAGYRVGVAWTLNGLGILDIRQGRAGRATKRFERALTVFEETGDRDGAAAALNGLGEAAHAVGRFADACRHHTAALTTATDTGARDERARAHAGLGRAHQALGDATTARGHLTDALAVYTDLGMARAEEEVRGHLAQLASVARHT